MSLIQVPLSCCESVSPRSILPEAAKEQLRFCHLDRLSYGLKGVRKIPHLYDLHESVL